MIIINIIKAIIIITITNVEKKKLMKIIRFGKRWN